MMYGRVMFSTKYINNSTINSFKNEWSEVRTPLSPGGGYYCTRILIGYYCNRILIGVLLVLFFKYF